MDKTPSKSPRVRRSPQKVDDNAGNITQKIRKPPPITPRRFTRFFTPRLQQPVHAVKTSRAALRAISGKALNARNSRKVASAISGLGSENALPRGKKRKLSFVLADASAASSPASQSMHAQDLIRSSPTIPERRTPIRVRHNLSDLCDTEDETEIDEDSDDEASHVSDPKPKIIPYRSRTVGGGILSSRLTGSIGNREAISSTMWQEETGNFCTGPDDINAEFVNPTTALPFSAAACHSNPLVAIGDEEGRIRLLDTNSTAERGMTQAWLTMTPHDNAIMDLEFSPDDKYLATASGDQSCQVIDVQTQTSLYLLGDHRCSVKKIAFQPGAGNQVLASCGRDGQINFWDLRCRNTPKFHVTRRAPAALEMTQGMRSIAPTHMIRDAHTVGLKPKQTFQRSKPNTVPGRSDFSITSLSFLGETRQHLLVTASEVNSVIKLWDIRISYGSSRKAPEPVSVTAAPKSHAYHRSFGITSMAMNTDGSRLYSLSRDHTVYVYSTPHLILGSSSQMSSKSKAYRTSEPYEGLQPLYGFRHPNLRVQTFWTRLAIRKATESHPELLAVGSSDDCAVLFPTNERYLTSANTQSPPLHVQPRREPQSSLTADGLSGRPTLVRSSSSMSFSNRLAASIGDENPIRIYQHGTPLIRGHDKEVTSLTWSSEGHLVTASDDYTVRCWREDQDRARSLRTAGENNGARWKSGWSNTGIHEFDDEY